MSAQQSAGVMVLCLAAFQRQPFTAAHLSSSMGLCCLGEESEHAGSFPCVSQHLRGIPPQWRISYSSVMLSTRGFLMPQSAGPSAEGFSTNWTPAHLQQCQRG